MKRSMTKCKCGLCGGSGFSMQFSEGTTNANPTYRTVTCTSCDGKGFILVPTEYAYKTNSR